MAFKDFEVVITTRIRDDSGVGAKATVSSVERMTQQATVAVQKSAETQTQAYIRMYATIEAGRREFVASQISAAEKAAQGTVTAYIKADAVIAAEERKLADTMIREARRAERARVEAAALAQKEIGKIHAGNTSIYGGPLAADISIAARNGEIAAVAIEKQTAATVKLASASAPLIAITTAEAKAVTTHTSSLTAQIARLKEATLVEKIKADTVRQGIATNALMVESQKAIQKSLQLSAQAEVDATKAELAMSGATTNLTVAMGGMSGGMMGVVGAAAAVILVMAAAAVIVGGMAKLTISGAEEFGKYGDAIWRLNAQTKISTEALSGLSLVAQETGGSTQQLAIAFTRLQVNIEKAITKPTGPAALAIKTLGLNLETLKHQTPTEQVGAVATAIENLHNQNVKAMASNALLGRGFQQLAPALKQLGGNLEEATRLSDKFGLTFSQERADAAHKLTVAVRDLGLAWEGFKIALGEGAVPALTAGLNVLSESIATNRAGFVQFGRDVGTAITSITAWFVENRSAIAEWAKWSVKASEDVLSGVKTLSEYLYTAFLEPVVITYRWLNTEIPGAAPGIAGYGPSGRPGTPPRQPNYAESGEYVSPGSSIPGLVRATTADENYATKAAKAHKEKTGALNTLKGLYAELTSQIENYDQKSTHLGTVDKEIARINSKELTPSMRAQVVALEDLIRAKASELDSLDVKKKADEKASKALESVSQETEQYKTKTYELTHATEDGAKASEIYSLYLLRHKDAALAGKAALDELKQATEEYVDAQAKIKTEKTRDETIKSLTAIDEKLKQMTGGKQATELEAFLKSVLDVKGLELKPTAFAPLLRLIQEAQTNPEAITVLRGMLSGLLSGAEGIAPGKLDATVELLTKLLTGAGQATSSAGRVAKKISDQNERLKEDLIASQEAVAVANETAAVRADIAWQNAHNDIVLGDQRARESMLATQQVIADQTVFHGEQSRAQILDQFAKDKSVTQIWAEGFVGAADAISGALGSTFDKITSKLGIFGSVIKNILSDLTRLVVDRVFRQLLDGLLPGGGRQSGGGGIGSFLGSILGGGGAQLTGGFAGGMGGVSFLGLGGGGITGSQTAQAAALAGIFGGGIASPPSLSASQGLTAAQIAAMAQGNVLGGTGGAGSLMGLLKGFGPMLPFLGLTTGMGLGVTAGGQSGLGRILGGIGGGLAGLGLGAAGFFALGGTVSAGSMGMMLGLLANPLTIGIGAALLIGAIILAKNKARQEAEKQRNVISNDTGTAIWALIDRARLGDITAAEANSQWNQIAADYASKVSQITDSKTHRNALLQWTNDFLPLKKILDAAVAGSVHRASDRLRMAPVFASGGYSATSQLIRVRPGEGWRNPGSSVVNVIPGRDLGYDSEYMYAPKGTQIIPRSEMRSSRGFQRGGVVGGSSNELSTLNIDSIEVYVDGDGIARAVVKTKDFKDATIKNVRIGQLERKI